MTDPIANPTADAVGGCALPTFIIIGAQKCATRWLRINLGEHPEIFTAKSEMHFWNNGHRVEKLEGYLPQAVERRQESDCKGTTAFADRFRRALSQGIIISTDAAGEF